MILLKIREKVRVVGERRRNPEISNQKVIDGGGSCVDRKCFYVWVGHMSPLTIFFYKKHFFFHVFYLVFINE